MNVEYQLQALAWEEKEDYSEGLRLFLARYGQTITYRALCMGTNPFNRQKLKNALLEGVDRAAATVAVATAAVATVATATPAQPDPAPAKPAMVATAADPVQQWRNQASLLMDERTILKQRLRDLPDPQRRDERKQTAHRILDITDELDRLFGRIWYFQEHGRIPESVDDHPEQPARQEYLNVRTYISKARKALRAATTQADRDAISLKIEQWERRKHELELSL